MVAPYKGPSIIYGSTITAMTCSGVARLVLLGGHLTALIECLTVLLECIILISVDMTYSTKSWTGTCPPRPALGYATNDLTVDLGYFQHVTFLSQTDP